MSRVFQGFLLVLWMGVSAFTWAANHAPGVVRWTTPEGVRVVFSETRHLPLVDIRVDVDAGSRREAQHQAGLAELTVDLLKSGAGQWSQQALDEGFASVGAQVKTHTDWDRSTVSLRTLSDPPLFKKAWSLFLATLTQPTFPLAPFKEAQQHAIESLKEAQTRPDFMAHQALVQKVYASHPYARTAWQTVSGLKKLTPQNVQAFYQHYYQPQNLVLTIVGALSLAESQALAAQLSQGLSVQKRVQPTLLPPAPFAAEKGAVVKITHSASQAHLVWGGAVLRREDPDYFPLLVGNYILGGGGFDSRLMHEIRDARGLAYSIHSYFSPYAEAGLFEISLQTRKEKAQEAIEVVEKTVQRFVEKGVTAEELAQAKANLVGSFPLRLDNNQKRSEYLAMMAFYRLPNDWLEQYPKSVQAVTQEQIHVAFKRRLLLKELVRVEVGR